MKFTPGIAIGSASGSLGGTTFSRNRFGMYTRTRAVPVNPDTSYQQNVRGHLAAASQGWGALTVAQQLAWKAWAQTHPVIDTLGQSQILTGHLAYIKCNLQLRLSGDTEITEPPVVGAPDALLTSSASIDIGVGGTSLTFTATPLGADERLIIRAAVVNSPGVSYVTNLLKEIVRTDKAQATGYDFESDLAARFGTLSVGQNVELRCQVLDTTTGLLSSVISARTAIVST